MRQRLSSLPPSSQELSQQERPSSLPRPFSQVQISSLLPPSSQELSQPERLSSLPRPSSQVQISSLLPLSSQELSQPERLFSQESLRLPSSSPLPLSSQELSPPPPFSLPQPFSQARISSQLPLFSQELSQQGRPFSLPQLSLQELSLPPPFSQQAFPARLFYFQRLLQEPEQIFSSVRSQQGSPMFFLTSSHSWKQKFLSFFLQISSAFRSLRFALAVFGVILLTLHFHKSVSCQ